jgi:hypothetical protein
MLVNTVLVWNLIPVEDTLEIDQINVLYGGKNCNFQLLLMKYNATGRNCNNISSFATLGT